MHKIITTVFDKNRKYYWQCETKSVERWQMYGWYYQGNTIKHCLFFKSAKWGNPRGRRGISDDKKVMKETVLICSNMSNVITDKANLMF